MAGSPPSQNDINVQLNLYRGGLFEVSIGEDYDIVPQALLCHYSPYFAARFPEASRDLWRIEVALDDDNGAVTFRGFRLFVEWMYAGVITATETNPTERVSRMIELARCANMLGVVSLEDDTARNIRTILTITPFDHRPELYQTPYMSVLTADHISSSFLLPKGHAVRRILAKAMIKPYLSRHRFKFAQELWSIPDFGADVVSELSAALRIQGGPQFLDPFAGELQAFDPCTLIFKWERIGERSGADTVTVDSDKVCVCALLEGCTF